MARDEWRRVDAGLKQRLTALNLFIDDLYNRQSIVKDGIFPRELLDSSRNFRPQCAGATPRFGVWAHICGTDLVRDRDGTIYVLEDNLRVPSRVSYMLENHMLMKRLFPRAVRGLRQTSGGRLHHAPTGWGRVQAICDYVHRHIAGGYQHARMTRTAFEAFYDKTGVCRDYAHLAVAFCRCMNIPARCCTGHLGDIGVPPPYGPMDFAAWFETFLDDRWYTFDARNNTAHIGRVLIARGRDASDVAISNTFGRNTLTSFRVWTDEVRAA